MVIDKTAQFEQLVVDSLAHCADDVQATSYSQQDSAPNHHGFTAFYDGEVYEVVITRIKPRR